MNLNGLEESSKRLVFWFLKLQITKIQLQISPALVLNNHKLQKAMWIDLENYKSQRTSFLLGELTSRNIKEL